MSFMLSTSQNISPYLPSYVNGFISSVSSDWANGQKKLQSNEEKRDSIITALYQKQLDSVKKHNPSAKIPIPKRIVEKEAFNNFTEKQNYITAIQLLRMGAMGLPYLTSCNPLITSSLLLANILDKVQYVLTIGNIAKFTFDSKNLVKGTQELSKVALPIIVSSALSLVSLKS